MHWKNMANYDYLGAYSLQGITNEVTLTIKTVKKEKVTGEGGLISDCIVAEFEEKKQDGVEVKPMVLNKTNCKTIEKVYGTGDVEQWVGKRITVYVAQTKYQREMRDCLRIKNEVPPVITYNCSVCGKEIEKATYDGSLAKYGVALCSKECLEKLNTGGNE